MFSFIGDELKKLLGEILDAAKNWLKKRYGDSGILVPPGAERARRNFVQRIANDLKQYGITFLATILTILVIVRLLVIYNYRTYLYQLESNVPSFYYDAYEIKLIGLAVAIIVICLAMLYLLWHWNEERRGIKKILFFIQSFIIIGFSITSLAPSIEIEIVRLLESKAFTQAYIYFNRHEYAKAREAFTTIADNTSNSSLAIEAVGFIAGTNYWTEDFEASIEQYAQLIVNYPQQVRREHYDSLHWAIYGLGKKHSLQDAENFIIETRGKFPTKELSPIRLGISPENYEYFRSNTLNVWGIANPEDRIKLKILVSKYPDDQYASLAEVLIGEATTTLLNSNLRDWAIFNKANDAFLATDFDEAILYFELFIDEFPRHRWADNARYLLARSYELSGDYKSALAISMNSAKSLANYRNVEDRLYAIALIDTYFKSDDLRDLININDELGRIYDAPLLEYCLAEQLFKERRFEEAFEQFEIVLAKYPGSSEAEFVQHNLDILESIIEIEHSSTPEKALDLARFFMSDPYNFNPSSFVIYNDLYQGNRNRTIATIGFDGPDWSYILETNDQLIAAQLSENFANQFPHSPKTAEALYLATLSYYHLAYPFSYSISAIGRNTPFRDYSEKTNETSLNRNLILDNLERLVHRLLTEHQGSEYTPEAITLAAIGFENFSRLDKTVSYMRMVPALYPDHKLANNALIYVARTYVKLAFNERDLALKRAYYELAEATYEQIMWEYPSGHVFEEAKTEVNSVRQHLLALRGN